VFHACALGRADAVPATLTADADALGRVSPTTGRSLVQTARGHAHDELVALLQCEGATYDLFTPAYIGDAVRVAGEVDGDPAAAA
jgi:hypothetical protein